MSWLPLHVAPGAYDNFKLATPPEYEGESGHDDASRAEELCPVCGGWCMSRAARERYGCCTRCSKRGAK